MDVDENEMSENHAHGRMRLFVFSRFSGARIDRSPPISPAIATGRPNPIVLCCIHTIALYVKYPITLYHFTLYHFHLIVSRQDPVRQVD
jgi:hypothetical protein